MTGTNPDPSTFDAADPAALRAAVSEWANRTAGSDPRLQRVGYLNSFQMAGSEEETHLDVVLIMEETDVPPAERVTIWDLSEVPVPTQPLVYTVSEWEAMVGEGGWMARKLDTEAVWVFGD